MVTSLEQFITKLASVDSAQRDEMLQKFNKTSSPLQTEIGAQTNGADSPSANEEKNITIPVRSRAGAGSSKNGKFYGATSFFQIDPSDEQGLPLGSGASHSVTEDEIDPAPESGIASVSSPQEQLAFEPTSALCQSLMRDFFNGQYQYHVSISYEPALSGLGLEGHYTDGFFADVSVS